MINLPYFGVHSDSDGIQYLFQDSCPEGFNYVGIRECSGMTTAKLDESCPHAIVPSLALRDLPAQHWNKFSTILKDPLVEAMLPIPKNEISGAYYLPEYLLHGKALEYFSCLERMSSPIVSSVKPLWSLQMPAIKKILSLTNVHPLVLTGAELEDSKKVYDLIRLASTMPRTLIISGHRELVLPPEVERLDTGLSRLKPLADLISLPFEHIGGEVLKRFCRHIPLNELMPEV